MSQNKATGFIESIEGARFTIHVRDDRLRPNLGIHVRSFVDGNKLVKLCSRNENGS